MLSGRKNVVVSSVVTNPTKGRKLLELESVAVHDTEACSDGQERPGAWLRQTSVK